MVDRALVERLERAVREATRWMLHSGIQDDGSGLPEAAGGFHAWFDADARRYAFVYSEITGYAITMLSYLHHRSPDGLFLESARRAANYLVERASDPESGFFRCRLDTTRGGWMPRTYAFDEAMILNGLASLLRLGDEPRYRQSAEACARRLIERWQREDGSFEPARSLSPDDVLDKPTKWSRQAGTFQVKNAIGLLNFAELTGAMDGGDVARKTCDWALGRQEESGRFTTSRFDGSVHLHPHCYTAEGLWSVGKILGRNDYIAAAARAVRWALERQLPSGGFARIVTGEGVNCHERADITAQVLRLTVLLVADGHLEEHRLEAVARGLSHLLTFQRAEGAPEERGGFIFGFQDDGARANHVNAWCTMFSLQVMDLYLRCQRGGIDASTWLLV
jgi:hypothetical protein